MRLTERFRFNYTCTLGSLVNPANLTIQLYAYNWTCQQFGYTDKVQIDQTSSFNPAPLDSVLVINFDSLTLPPRLMYAGKHYGHDAQKTLLPDPFCYSSGGQYACEVQFDCGKEVNMGDWEGGQQWRNTMILTEEITPDGYVTNAQKT
jgi:hypothetical protein